MFLQEIIAVAFWLSLTSSKYLSWECLRFYIICWCSYQSCHRVSSNMHLNHILHNMAKTIHILYGIVFKCNIFLHQAGWPRHRQVIIDLRTRIHKSQTELFEVNMNWASSFYVQRLWYSIHSAQWQETLSILPLRMKTPLLLTCGVLLCSLATHTTGHMWEFSSVIANDEWFKCDMHN